MIINHDQFPQLVNFVIVTETIGDLSTQNKRTKIENMEISNVEWFQSSLIVVCPFNNM